MANRPQHDAAGVIAGMSLAIFQARSQSHGCLCLEALGGALGGLAGSRLPDVLDPPTHPGHRALAHGALPMGSVGYYVANQLTPWQEQMRAKANEIARTHSADPKLTALLLEAILRFAAGFVAGAAAGYASHLFLDAGTKRSLPFVA